MTDPGHEPPVVRRRRRDEVARRHRTRKLLGATAVASVLLGGTVVAVQLGGARDRVEATTETPVGSSTTSTSTTTSTVPAPAPTAPPDEALPDSGAGRRVVFSVGRQRMWWVDEAGTVLRTSLVSGRAGTPGNGVFQVYSKTLDATGIDGSHMDHFVRFTKGPNGWAIGFHDIPEKDGVPVQTVEQLGQPLSHGCIRQRDEDAAFTWDFLQVGDIVVVVA